MLIDCNLSWKQHIDYISMKISKGIGIIARLRHLMPFCTLLNIYVRSGRILYFLRPWCLGSGPKYSFGQNDCHSTKAGFASNVFADYKPHSVPLFVNSGILSVKLLYFNRLPPCYMILRISVLHPISQIYLLTPNKLIPTPRGRQ